MSLVCRQPATGRFALLSVYQVQAMPAGNPR